MKSYERIAKILKTDKDNIRLIEERFSSLTGKTNVIDKIVEDNDAIIVNRLNQLGLTKDVSAKEIHEFLIKKIEVDNRYLSDFLGKPSLSNSNDWQRVLLMAAKIANNPKGFFLKIEVAREFLRANPPRQVLRILGYSSVDEMLKTENVFEIFSALRFIEGNDWLNRVFFRQYERLRSTDFEYREITVKALSEKWAVLAQDFIKKKYHNISHLKELGVVFVIPLALNVTGAVMRNFSLILHYLNEIPFYSSLFERFAKTENSFADNLISSLRGDVIDKSLSKSSKSQWLVIQRYLAKDDENDWRLFFPHINPEALHWERAERMLAKAGETIDGFSASLFFWQNLNWVGDYFKTEADIDVLLSFNLVDTSMSLVKGEEPVKYIYHHQESLWNKIFCEYFGEEKMEETMKENIIKGWFEV